MDEFKDLLTPQNCALVLIGHQPGLVFAVQSMDGQDLLNKAVVFTKTAGVDGRRVRHTHRRIHIGFQGL